MRKYLLKSSISITLISTLLLWTVLQANAFKKMDVCNTTNGDTSWNYYDWLCTKDGIKVDNDDIFIKNKKESLYIKKEDTEIFNSKLKKSNIKISHVPFWLSSNKNATKDKQLCKIATSFDILNDDWTLNYTYYPQWCQPKIDYSNVYEDSDIDFESDNKWVDNFINDLFGGSIIEKKEIVEKDDNLTPEKVGGESLDFLDDLFWDSSSSAEEENYDFSSASEEPVDEDTTNSEETIEDADDILKEIFGKTNTDSKISLKWKQIVSAIREYNSSKVRIRVWNIEANVISDDMDYNTKVANLLRQVDNEFKIDSIKNDFAKNVSRVSYSLSTYNDTTDLETKEVFRNKLVTDLKKLKKKYKILKKKDRIISKSLEKRGQL